MAWLTGYAAPVCRWLAIFVVTAGFACRDPDVERLTDIKDKMCACKTASCAEQEMKVVPQSTIKSTYRTQAIAREMLGCLARLHAAERPLTDPDGEAPAEGEPSDDGLEHDHDHEHEPTRASDPRTSDPASARTR